MTDGIKKIRFALPTGRSLDDCKEILEGAGLPTERLRSAGRMLVIDEGDYRYLLGKPTDIPTLVSQGAADIALIGSDVIAESQADVCELLDTERGKCIMAVAGPPAMADMFDRHVSSLMGMRVATKYVRTANRCFKEWGAQIRILNLNGSVELAPLLGLADCIFDIVQTGGTLRANGLIVIRSAADISLRLIANRSSMQLRFEELRDTIDAIGHYVRDTRRDGGR